MDNPPQESGESHFFLQTDLQVGAVCGIMMGKRELGDCAYFKLQFIEQRSDKLKLR